MSGDLNHIRNKALSFLQAQLGAVSFEYVLIIGGVSVVAIGLLAVGADAVMKQLLIYGICENFDDIIVPGTQWPCEFGGSSFWGW